MLKNISIIGHLNDTDIRQSHECDILHINSPISSTFLRSSIKRGTPEEISLYKLNLKLRTS